MAIKLIERVARGVQQQSIDSVVWIEKFEMVEMNTLKTNQQNEKVMKPAPQIFKLARQVIVHWPVNQPFYPAIQSAVKTKWRGAYITQDTGRADVANRTN